MHTVHTIDATDKVLGRLAVEVSILLRGKHKPTWAPNVDDGDTVVIENVDKIRVTGKKLDQKLYRKHTGYPGHLRETTLRERMVKDASGVFTDAVSGMLPKNKLRNEMLKRLIIK